MFHFSCDQDFTLKLKSNLKESYDILKAEKILSKNALPALLLNNFEAEQIWQQIELQNENFSTQALTDVSKVLTNKNELVFRDIVEDNDYNIEDPPEQVKDVNKHGDDLSSDEEYQSEIDNNKDLFDTDNESNNDENSSHEIPATNKNMGNLSSTRKSIVDDDFFKLDEMESFLRAEEKNESKQKANNDESESDEGSIDLFKPDSDNDEEDEKVKKAKFKDFFVSKIENKEPKRNKFLEEMESESEDEPSKSTFELRQGRLQERIGVIEENLVAKKSWTLQGEISAENRPQNSLLEEVVEFDLTSRPGKSITTKFCKKYFMLFSCF